MLSRNEKQLIILTEAPKKSIESFSRFSPSPNIFNRYYMPSPVLGTDCSTLNESDFYPLPHGVHNLMKEIGNKKVKQTYYNENML